jgi:hypothetical protein
MPRCFVPPCNYWSAAQQALVYDWIDQAKAACAPYEIPVVVCRGDKRELVVVQPLDDWLKLAKHELPER